jgi:hypothetical protein
MPCDLRHDVQRFALVDEDFCDPHKKPGTCEDLTLVERNDGVSSARSGFAMPSRWIRADWKTSFSGSASGNNQM